MSGSRSRVWGLGGRGLGFRVSGSATQCIARRELRRYAKSIAQAARRAVRPLSHASTCMRALACMTPWVSWCATGCSAAHVELIGCSGEALKACDVEVRVRVEQLQAPTPPPPPPPLPSCTAGLGPPGRLPRRLAADCCRGRCSLMAYALRGHEALLSNESAYQSGPRQHARVGEVRARGAKLASDERHKGALVEHAVRRSCCRGGLGLACCGEPRRSDRYNAIYRQ